MLTHPPAVVGLTICRDFVREPSGNYSAIRSFTGCPVETFPGSGDPFCVFAVLTDSQGEADAELVVTWFGEDDIREVRRVRGRVPFPHRLQLVECVFRFRQFPFPGSGVYLFTLFLDGVWTAQRTLRVYRKGDSP